MTIEPRDPTSLIWNYFVKENKDLSKCKEESLLLLANLVRKYLAIPASSTKSEHVFSAGGNVVTAKRISLEPGKVEALVVINKNKTLLHAYQRNLRK